MTYSSKRIILYNFINFIKLMNLQHRQSKIQQKRKQTSRKDFVMEICSRTPIVYTKEWWTISKFPKSDRIAWVTTSIAFADTDHMTSKDYSMTERSLFAILLELIQSMQFPGMRHIHAENADYSDVVINSHTAYLSSTVISWCENVVYSTSVKDHSRNVFESMMVRNNCENIFSSKSIIKSSNIFYSQSIHNCNNIRFSHNMIGCHECLFCDHLENASYCIWNTHLSKEEYIQKKTDILSQKAQFTEHYKYIVAIPWDNLLCTESEGRSNIECQHISNSYYCYNVNQGRNLFLHGSAKWAENSFDCYTGWSPRVNNMYAVTSSGDCEHIYCSGMIDEWSSNLYYCMYCYSCSFCLWCVGLQNKSYCILNKQYSKEEWYIKVDEIFSQMEKDRQLWSFFPASINPFYFNDTAAYLIDPSFTKEEVTAAWYLRRDEPIKVDIPADADIVQSSNLDQFESFDKEWNRIISADILKKVIQDESWNYYRIIPMEYKFLMKHGLPLPRQHWLERMKQNFRIN